MFIDHSTTKIRLAPKERNDRFGLLVAGKIALLRSSNLRVVVHL